MDGVTQAFLLVLRGFLCGEPVALSLSDDEWNALYRLAFTQSLSGLLCHMTADCDKPDAVARQLESDALNTAIKGATQQQALDQLRAAFTAAKVTFLPLKGAVVRGYYAVPELRTMGDIDIAVPDADRANAEQVLRDCGFTLHKQEGGTGVWQRQMVLLELHDRHGVTLFDCAKQENLSFPQLWERVVRIGAYERALPPAEEMAMLLGHFAKHLTAEGSGIRPLLDIAAAARHNTGAPDTDAVLRLLAPYGMTAFAESAWGLCRRLFDAVLPVPAADDAQVQAWLSRLLREGTFGADDRLLLAQLRRKRGILRWVFPPAALLKARYPYAARHPWLLPAAFFERLGQGLTKHRRTHQKRVAYADSHRAELAADAAFFKQIGL